MALILKLAIAIIVLGCNLIIASEYVTMSNPPPPEEQALTARYIIHVVDWATISTVSTRDDMQGYPLGNVKSMSDGPLSQGTGVPYFFLTKEDLTGLDIDVDNICTLTASLAQTDYCARKKFDAQDPRCARVILAGHMIKVANTTDEYEFAKESLFSRHPQMADWPKFHNFYITKLNVESIMVLDWIGRGVEFVTPEDYFNANGITMHFLDEELQKMKMYHA